VTGDGTTEEIDKVRVGDTVTDSLPGQPGTQSHKVKNVIVTTTDHDFVDITIAMGTSTADPPGNVASRVAAAPTNSFALLGALLTVRSRADTLTTTYSHPFYDETQAAFVPAAKLRVGDVLQTPTGTATVTRLRLYHSTQTTYDLTISGLHTYYVMAGSAPVLVHNCDITTDGGRNGVAPCQHVCMGVNPHSDDLAKEIGAHTFNGDPWGSTNTDSGLPLWVRGVIAAAKDNSTKISFTLDGLYGADGKLAASAQDAFDVNLARGRLLSPEDALLGGNGTAWELATVVRSTFLGENPRAWTSIDWYWQGSIVKIINPLAD
jgi:hypothetical protein